MRKEAGGGGRPTGGWHGGEGASAGKREEGRGTCASKTPRLTSRGKPGSASYNSRNTVGCSVTCAA